MCGWCGRHQGRAANRELLLNEAQRAQLQLDAWLEGPACVAGKADAREVLLPLL